MTESGPRTESWAMCECVCVCVCVCGRRGNSKRCSQNKLTRAVSCRTVVAYKPREENQNCRFFWRERVEKLECLLLGIFSL